MGRNGPCKEVSQLRLIETMSRAKPDKFVGSVAINANKKTSGMQKRPAVVPNIIDNIKKDATTFLGIHLTFGVCSWALVSYKMEVLDWNCTSYSLECTTSPIFNIVNSAHNLAKILPYSDVYITEDINFVAKQRSGSKNIHTTHEESKLMSAILTSLAVQHGVQSCFVMCPNSSAKNFHLIVGNEVVSADCIMKTFFSEYYEMDGINGKKEQLHISESLKDKYREQTPVIREQMSWSLLKALTFIKLLALSNYSRE